MIYAALLHLVLQCDLCVYDVHVSVIYFKTACNRCRITESREIIHNVLGYGVLLLIVALAFNACLCITTIIP